MASSALEDVKAYSSIEFLSISRAVGVGFLVMGFIGYAVKLIHIPINNILVPNPLLGRLWTDNFRSLETDFQGIIIERLNRLTLFSVYNRTFCESN